MKQILRSPIMSGRPNYVTVVIQLQEAMMKNYVFAALAANSLILMSCDKAPPNYWRNMAGLPSSQSAIKCREKLTLYKPEDILAACTEELQSADLSDPWRGFTIRNRGLAHYSLGNYAAAIADLNVAIQLIGSETRWRLQFHKSLAYSVRGAARNKLGQHEAALADFDAAIALEPDFHLHYVGRARTRWDAGNRAGALEDARNSLRLGARLDPSGLELFQKDLKERGLYKGDVDGTRVTPSLEKAVESCIPEPECFDVKL